MWGSQPDAGSETRMDADGLVIPPNYPESGWNKFTYKMREQRSAAYLAKLDEPPKPEKVRRPGYTKFTTGYAAEWGRDQGWKEIDRERWTYHNGRPRSHDCELQMDVIFDDLVDGRVGVQGAGKGQRKDHYENFLAKGGPDAARRRNIRIYYVEFVRGNKTPIKVEQWA